ncbi:MAG: glutamate racemase [Candidatus Paceibacterota bacterium]
MENKVGKMKIGIFDSGLGGLIIARSIRKLMPEYDYMYLGDTKRVPYGNRSHEAVFEFTKQGVDYLFTKQNCGIVVVACNTASARSLRRIQQEYLPNFNKTRKLMGFEEVNVLGVLIPTAEECAKYKRVGIIGTTGTIASNTFVDEIKKIHAQRSLGGVGDSKTIIFQNSAPMLVPLSEAGEDVLAKPFLVKYLKPFLNKSRRQNGLVPRPKASGEIEALALGCTHYPFYKEEIRKILGKKITVLSQDEIIPKKLKEYFKKHTEIENKLSKNKTTKILLTDLTKNIEKLSQKWFGKNTKPELVKL